MEYQFVPADLSEFITSVQTDLILTHPPLGVQHSARDILSLGMFIWRGMKPPLGSRKK